MNKSNSIETINKTNLIDQTKFTLSEVSKVERYFNQEIKGRKSNSKRLSKYVAAFDYIDKNFNCFVYSRWWSVYYFFYNCYWSSCSNIKCKF